MIDSVLGLGWPALAAMALGAVLVGFSKTSFGGLGAVASALYALLMPARESTAAVLLLLLVGDAVALLAYGRDVRWRVLARLLPAVLPGLALGAVFLRFVDDTSMRRSIAVILLVMLALQLWQRRRPPVASASGRAGAGVTLGAGAAAGFTTMTANAAAPVMALYLLAQRFDKRLFLATNAWFFAIVNLCKVPFAASVGLFTPLVFGVAVVMMPAVLLGTVIGRGVIRHVSQRQFEVVTLAATAFSAVLLLVR